MSVSNYSNEEIAVFFKKKECIKCSARVNFINTEIQKDSVKHYEMDYYQCSNCLEFYKVTLADSNTDMSMISEKQEKFKIGRDPDFINNLRVELMTSIYRKATPSGNWEDILENSPIEDGFHCIPTHKYTTYILSLFRVIANKAIKYNLSTRELAGVICFVFDSDSPIPNIENKNIQYYSFFKDIYSYIGKQFKF